MVLKTNTVARGIRNNNPLNIREALGGGDAWNGERAENTDADFEEFKSPEYGIRAAVKILQNYRDYYGLNTITGIIERWAPSSENNTNAYVESVALNTGIDKSKVLATTDYDALIKAMIYHENGSQPYSDEIILTGINWGLA